MTYQDNISIMNIMKRQRRSKDIGIEGFAARWYDKNTKKNRLSEMKSYAQEVSKHLSDDGSSVLEVAPGPGYLAIELAKLGNNFDVVGLDISNDFIEIARKNAREAGVNVEFRQGSVAQIPYSDNKFDFIICTAAFKNFKEPLKALSEMHRVLKKSTGTALIIDMNRNATNHQIEDYISRSLGVKWLERVFFGFIFKYILRNGAYTRDEFISLISKTAFTSHEIREEGIGLYVYLKK